MWRSNSGIARAHAAVLLTYALITAAMTWPLAANLGSAIPGDGFDGWQNYWNLWWLKRALVDHLQNPFTTDLLYYPTGVDLYFHTLNPFNGLVSLPVQLSAGLISAYNSIVWISWVLAGYGVFLLVRWLVTAQSVPTASRFAWAAPFVAGLIFSFSPFHMAHLLGHMQVMSLEWIPFYVLALLRGTERARRGANWRRDGLLAGLFLTLVGLCDWYFVLYLFLFTGLYLLWTSIALVAQQRRSSLPALVGSALVPATAGIIFLVALSPILIPMIGQAVRFSFMERPSSDLYILSATVVDFLIPNRLHTLLRPESFAWIGNQIAPVSERTIGIGYLALALSVYAAVRRPQETRFWIGSAVFFLLIALGPAMQLFWLDWNNVASNATIPESTPYGFLNSIIPFMRISRSVSRFALMVQFSVAVLAGLGFNELLRNRSQAIRPAVTTLTVALCTLIVLAEYWVAPFPLSPPDTPSFYRQLAAMPDSGAVLNVPMNFDRPGYLLYQTVHGKPLTVAYISRDDPRTLTERLSPLQQLRHLGPDILADQPEEVGQTVLTDLDISWVVLDRYKMPGGLERSFTTATAEAIVGPDPPIYTDERLTVYRIAPPDQPVPYLLLGPTGWGQLTEVETRQPARLVEPAGAELTVRHPQSGMALTVRYRSSADAGLAVVTGGQAEGIALPPSETSAVRTIPLSVNETTPESLSLWFAPDPGGWVAIEMLSLTHGIDHQP